MNRRDSLKAIGLAAAGGTLLLDACGPKTKATKEVVAGGAKLPGVTDAEYSHNQRLEAEQFFAAHELATIGVLADIIIPADGVSGSATDAGVVHFIEFMVKDIPAYQTPLRGGLKWLDIQAQRRYDSVFVACKTDQQLALVEDIAYPTSAPFGMEQGVAFFNLMRNLTASGFFTSEMGVKDIGYVGNRPGVWEGVPQELLVEHGFI